MKKILLIILVALLSSGITVAAMAFVYGPDIDIFEIFARNGEAPDNPEIPDAPEIPSNIIMVTTPFYIPPLDLRGYDMNPFDVQEWFIERINYHRALEGIHGYVFYTPAIVTSIEHSLDMRNNNFGRNAASDGRTHQERHHRWMGYARTRVTSAHSSSHWVSDGPLTRECVTEIVDRVMNVEQSRDFLLNPTYYYIGIGFSIQDNGRGRLSVTMATPEGERAAHRARSQAERAEHREAYLQMVRERMGWVPPAE